MKHLSVMATLIFVMSLALSACGQLEGDALTFRTADPRLSIGFRLLPAPPVTIEPSVLPTVEATATPECVNAKANINAANEHIYHLPGDANYNNVKIDKDGEAIYCTEQEAIDAGFRKALR